MKTLITPKRTLIVALIAVFTVPLLCSSSVNASDRRSFNYWEQSGFTRVQGHVHKYKSCCGKTYYRYHKQPVVVAACTTSVTLQPLPTYVCCELRDKNGHHIWRDTWVSGSCRAASPYARHDEGCTMNSPVYGTGVPILQRGNCQFSFTTGKYR